MHCQQLTTSTCLLHDSGRLAGLLFLTLDPGSHHGGLEAWHAHEHDDRIRQVLYL
eukprot:COSAG06_NODE_49808_length_323_cov_0.571429_1_plen_54_part_10